MSTGDHTGLEAASGAARRRADLAWLVGLRMLSTFALLTLAAFPAWEDFTGEDEAILLWRIEGGGSGFINGYSVLTLVVAVLTLLVPPSRLGRKVRTALAALYLCFAGGHLLLAGAYNGDESSEVFANYWLAVAVAGLLAFLWASTRRGDQAVIDAVG